jgi:hypothetical protein
MQVEMVGTGERQHVASSVGQTLIAAGLATEVKPSAPQADTRPNLRFIVGLGTVVEDYEFPPVVHAQCSTCGHKSATQSFKGTAHLADIRHCRIVERCGEQTAAEYLAVYGKWASRSRNKKTGTIVLPPQPKISPYTEKHVHEFGMKTQAELKSDVQAALIVAAKK